MASKANVLKHRAARPVWPRALCVSTGKVLALILVAAGALTGGIPQAGTQSEAPTEYQIKAAFLYNFAKFVEWPADAFADPHAPIVLGVVGEDPFGNVLDKIVLGKTVNGRGLVIKRLKPGPDLRNCHILFLSLIGKKASGTDPGEPAGIERVDGRGDGPFCSVRRSDQFHLRGEQGAV